MDSISPHIPAPSTAWRHLAESHTGEPNVPVGLNSVPTGGAGSDGDSIQLRARLLRMIVKSEQTRKAAAADASNAR
jgi:hypothetical protein